MSEIIKRNNELFKTVELSRIEYERLLEWRFDDRKKSIMHKLKDIIDKVDCMPLQKHSQLETYVITELEGLIEALRKV